jgi:hypothetical protein
MGILSPIGCLSRPESMLEIDRDHNGIDSSMARIKIQLRKVLETYRIQVVKLKRENEGLKNEDAESDLCLVGRGERIDSITFD